ncbi:hypothetical protein V8E36_000037 [Tilletia maclaganii]
MLAITTSLSHQQDPTSLSKRQKWLMLLTLCLASFTSNLFGAAHLTSFPQIAAALDVTIAQVAESIGLGSLGLGVGPLLWSPLSSALGRRPVYLAAWTLFLPCCAWCAASRSFDSFAAARFCGAFCASVAQTLPATTISDVWNPEYRGTAIAAWTVAMITGPMLAAPINAALTQAQDWSWMYWLLLMLAGLELVLPIVFVPETQAVIVVEDEGTTTSTAPIESPRRADVEEVVGAATSFDLDISDCQSTPTHSLFNVRAFISSAPQGTFPSPSPLLCSSDNPNFTNDSTTVQLAFTALLVTIVCALGVQASNPDQHKTCRDYAIQKCPNYEAPDNAKAFATLRYICMRPWWEKLTTNNNCPHTQVGCLCYNGCVNDVWSDGGDVGGWCTVACKLGGQKAGPTCK